MTEEFRSGRLVIDGEDRPANQVQLEGVDAANQPHHRHNFAGAGVTATDEGAEPDGRRVARVTIPEAVTGTGGPASGYQIEVPSGAWVGPQFGGSNTDSALDSTDMHLGPFIIPVAMTFDRISAWIGLTPFIGPDFQGEAFRMGVYSAHPTTYFPDSLMLNVGPIVPTSFADEDQPISPVLNLPAGLYWYATQGDFDPNDFPPPFGINGANWSLFSPGGRSDSYDARVDVPVIDESAIINSTGGRPILGLKTAVPFSAWPATITSGFGFTNDVPPTVNLRRQ